MTVTVNGTTGVSLVQDSTITSAKIVDGTIAPADTQVGALPSMVWLSGYGGYGSTALGIRRFATTQLSQGADVTYTDSVANGATFTINTNGIYSIHWDCNPAANGAIALTIADTFTTVAASSITNQAQVLGTTFCTNIGTCTFTGYLASGSVIRAHGTTNAGGGGNLVDVFTIVRVA